MRVRRRRLHRVHRGVYAVGHTGLSIEGRWMAAVLAAGRGAVLSHGSAAAHWGLLRPFRDVVDVSVPSHAGRRRREGIRIHRRAALKPSEVTRRLGIPVTTPARTVADLDGAVSPRLARRARRQAEVFGLPLGELRSDRSRSDLERAFLGLCRRHGLPSPQVNARVGRWTVDFLWRSRRLVVETDGYVYHRGSVAFEDDHARDLDLRSAGCTVLRYDDTQLESEPERVAADVAGALALSSASRG